VMGHTGPWRDYAGFGPTVQAFSGLTHLTTYPGQSPLGLGYSFSDHVAGLYASLALLNALDRRRLTGEGQYIDLSQTETMASLLGDYFLDVGRKQQDLPPGASVPAASPEGIYRCLGEDRWCALTVASEEAWSGFKRALGSPDWAEDARFVSAAARRENRADLDILIQGWASGRTAEEAAAALQREGVPAGMVQNAADLVRDPQLRERGFFIETEPPELGKTAADGTPIHLSAGAPEYRRAAPAPGQDNDYVYRELLGMNDTEIEQLHQEGVI